MLSAESATGQYPVEAVSMMDQIIRSVEGHKFYHSIVAASDPGEEETLSHAVATTTAVLARRSAKAIVTYTSCSTSAARVARKRPESPILALTPNLATARRLCLLLGVPLGADRGRK